MSNNFLEFPVGIFFPLLEALPQPFPEPGPWPPQMDRLPQLEIERIRWPLKYSPATIKILVLIDGSGAYDTVNNFSLGLMLQDAFNVGTPAGTLLPADYPEYARFNFTLAHRLNGLGTTPTFENFIFSASKLAGFQEVWLFGISTAAPYLVGAELDALTQFMNNGGGILAMGDHEDLGLGLCGNVPRVKSMRKWWYNMATAPAGELQAPDGSNLTRNDTVQLIAGIDPGFSGEGDGKPQPILPTYRFGHNWWKPWRHFRYPHPVLCGPRGAITVFPDHPHEGECIVPATLSAVEYPGGVAPEVIAKGRNVVGRSKGGNLIVDPREFGLLGAYDGHLPAANVGRVLVDSTWHHWFNVNLRGLDSKPHSIAYKDILAYFRNVAVWLAPKASQKRMRLTGTTLVLYTQEMIERTLTVRELKPDMFYRIGIEARDALARIAPQCQVNTWLLELLDPQFPAMRARLSSLRFDSAPDCWDAIVFDRISMTALGGAIASLALAARKDDFKDGDAQIEAAEKISSEGVRLGIKQAQIELVKSRQRFDKAVSAHSTAKS